MWLVKPAIVVGLLWYFTRGASAASGDVSTCPPGFTRIPFLNTCWDLGGGSTPAAPDPGIGITVVKTSGECDPASPLYDPARCVAQAGVQRVVPRGARTPGISPGVGIYPLAL